MDLGCIIVKGCWNQVKYLQVHFYSWVSEKMHRELTEVVFSHKLEPVDLCNCQYNQAFTSDNDGNGIANAKGGYAQSSITRCFLGLKYSECSWAMQSTSKTVLMWAESEGTLVAIPMLSM